MDREIQLPLFTEDQIKQAGVDGEVNSIDVSHVIEILKSIKQPVFTVGEIYELDGIRFRLTKFRGNGIMTFQQLNEDGSDYKTFYKNSDGEKTNIDDHGIRLISNRLHEMKIESPELLTKDKE